MKVHILSYNTLFSHRCILYPNILSYYLFIPTLYLHYNFIQVSPTKGILDEQTTEYSGDEKLALLQQGRLVHRSSTLGQQIFALQT